LRDEEDESAAKGEEPAAKAGKRSWKRVRVSRPDLQRLDYLDLRDLNATQRVGAQRNALNISAPSRLATTSVKRAVKRKHGEAAKGEEPVGKAVKRSWKKVRINRGKLQKVDYLDLVDDRNATQRVRTQPLLDVSAPPGLATPAMSPATGAIRAALAGLGGRKSKRKRGKSQTDGYDDDDDDDDDGDDAAKRQALDYLDLEQGRKQAAKTTKQKKKRKTKAKGSISREFQQLLTRYRRAKPGLEKRQALVAMLQAPGATKAVAPIGASPNKRLGKKMKRARRATAKPPPPDDDDDDDDDGEKDEMT
jgi:hypothetical protein